MNLACAVYTRKSSEEGLEQGFNSLDAQREACEAYVLSQKAQGWKVMGCYDDGGFSGGNVDRPGLQRLLADIALRRVRIVVVYKVDRLTRSLADFAKLVELFDAHGVSFVSVTQAFNTTSSMGRLTLNVLLSFAQFEREVTGERIRDKIAASKRKGLWMGGTPPMGYRPFERTLVIVEKDAVQVRGIYRRYLELGCVTRLKRALDAEGCVTPVCLSQRENARGGKAFSRGHLYRILSNPIYAGDIAHRGQVHAGQHPAIIAREIWDRVQTQLAAHRQGQRVQAHAADPSLLTGRAFDAHGHRLTPSHTRKGVKRYRYYVAQPHEGEALRLPAQELDGAVIDAVMGFLSDSTRVAEAFGEIEASVLQQGFKRAQGLLATLQGSRSDRMAVVQSLVEQVVVHPDRLELKLQLKALGVEDHFDFEVPVQLKVIGHAMRLVVRAKGSSVARTPDARVVALLSKAQDWFARLTAGDGASIQSIAEEAQVGGSYVTRVIYLAFLAPDIVQRLVNGELAHLSVDRLGKMVPLPMDWAEQRELLRLADGHASAI